MNKPSSKIDTVSSSNEIAIPFDQAPPVITDSRSAGERIHDVVIGRMAKAETLDDLFGATEQRYASTYKGHTMRIESVNIVQRIDDSGEVKVGAEVTAFDITDDRDIDFYTSAKEVVPFLAKALSMGWLPVTIKLGSRKAGEGTMLTVEKP